jgi:malate dehydrogenase
MARKKIALIGAGQIGGTLALIAAQRGLGDIVLYDIIEGMPQGKALDIMEGRAIYGYDVEIIGTNSYEDVKGADLTIITAGVPRKPGMSRDDLFDVNIKIIKEVAGKIKETAPDAFHIVLSNPLDVMVTAFKQLTGFSKHQVIGMAGVLDSSRFRCFVAMELGISVNDIQAMVLGGHGPTMVPLPRYSTVAGVPITTLIPKERLEAIIKRTREAGTEIVGLLKTGSAYYSPALAAITIAEAYLYDRKRLFACAAYLEGEYGLSGFFMGVPVWISGKGMEKVVELELTPEEKEALYKSAEAVKKLTDTLKL